jgi:hypothetical protein
MPTTGRPLKLLVRVLGGFLLVLIVFFSIVQTGQWIARWRAERLLSDIRSLRLQRSTWSDAQRIINRWGRWGRYKGTCDASICEYDISITDWVTDVALELNRFPRLVRFAEPTLSRLMPLFGARLPQVFSRVSVHDGKVVGIDFSVATEVPNIDGVLMSSSASTARPEYYVEWPERNPHPEYSVVMRYGTIHAFFTEFNADAKDEDLAWLMEFNLSCMTRLSPCKEDSDLRPSAFAHYLAESKNRHLFRERSARCDFPLQQLVEAAENIALVRATFTSGSDPEKPTLAGELIESLKGTSSWQVGGIRDVFSVDGGRYGDHRTPVQIVLFPDDENRVYAHVCGIIPATAENLKIVRLALANAVRGR